MYQFNTCRPPDVDSLLNLKPLNCSGKNDNKPCKPEALCTGPNADYPYFHCVCASTGEPKYTKGSNCDLPPASSNTTSPLYVSPLISTSNDKKESNVNSTTILSSNVRAVNWTIIAEILIPSVIIVGLILFCFWKKRRKTESKQSNLEKVFISPIPSHAIKDVHYTPNPQYVVTEMPGVPLLYRSCITNLEKIGEGFFGEVYRGNLTTVDSDGKEHVKAVAIKTLKRSASPEAEEDFMREVENMISCQHPNILTLLGICRPENNTSPPWMIVEYMEHGDLLNVLRCNGPNIWNSGQTSLTLSLEDLLYIALQIAKGMEYLASHRFVHRDLACRNCLVGMNLTVKISDFGLSRDVYACNYYKMSPNREMPVRWMSPESIAFRIFTPESDVWSYGVVLWEIYTFGQQPYYEYSAEEVHRFIPKKKQEYLLKIPDNCPSEVADIMKSCWRFNPKERINFTEICNRLSKLRNIISQHNIASLPRPPSEPITIDCPTFFDDEPEDDLDEDDYLRPKSPLLNLTLNEYMQDLIP